MNRIPGEISRAARVSVSHDALLVLSDGSEQKVTITDVSSGGFHLQTSDSVPIGEHVFLRVDRYGDFPAQIRWSFAGEAGGVFLEPVEIPES